jgi:hypothetical protein
MVSSIIFNIILPDFYYLFTNIWLKSYKTVTVTPSIFLSKLNMRSVSL